MRRRILIPLGLLSVLVGCTVLDDTVVVDLGTTRPSLADPDLATQTVQVGVNVPRTIQTIRWNSVSKFRVDGLAPDATCDLNPLQCPQNGVFNPSTTCAFLDTALSAVQFEGACGGGLIVPADPDDPVVTVTPTEIEISDAQVFRLAPIVLPDMADYDGDNVVNVMDNCVLVDNPDQLDTGNKGFGDACTVFDTFLGTPFVDNDGDGVPDVIDNCPFTPNPMQEDDGILFNGRQVPDAIGNACSNREQVATIQLANNSTFTLQALPVAMGVQPFRGNSWLTVDFNDLAALDCDWPAGTCEVVESQLKFCFNTVGGFSCP